MDESDNAQPIGRAWSYDGRKVRTLFEGVRISNSIAFSPDGRRMYFADTPQRVIWSYDYDGESGSVANRRVFVEVASEHGYPDGSTSTPRAACGTRNGVEEGSCATRPRAISTARSCCLARKSPAAPLAARIWRPRIGLKAAKLSREPEAGAMFAVDVGVKGLADAVFAQ